VLSVRALNRCGSALLTAVLSLMTQYSLYFIFFKILRFGGILDLVLQDTVVKSKTIDSLIFFSSLQLSDFSGTIQNQFKVTLSDVDSIQFLKLIQLFKNSFLTYVLINTLPETRL
jgi:hypothetical protein